MLILDLNEDERFEKAISLVQEVNRLAWSGNVSSNIDVPKQVAGKQCPLCLVQSICLGPSCLKVSGNATVII